MNKDKHWTEDFFNMLYWEIFMKRTDERITNEVDLITDLIQFKPQSVMDVCCGVGDILSKFQQNGAVDTLGLEYSQEYVDNRHISTVIKADACEKNTDKKFDLVLNWFSSFAYFDKGKDKQMLQHCFNATRKVFVLEIFNSYSILSNFKDELIYQKKVNDKIYDIVRNSKYEPVTRKLHQNWSFQSSSSNLKYNTSVNLYFVDEILNQLQEVGFHNVNIYSYDGTKLSSFDIKSPRIIFVAKIYNRKK